MKYNLGEIEKQIRRAAMGNVMETYLVYPGISLSFITLNPEEISIHHDTYDHVLQLHYCHKGLLGWRTNNGNTVYLGPHDYSLHRIDYFTDSDMFVPDGSYQGLILTIDLIELSNHPLELLDKTGITGETLWYKFRENKEIISLSGNAETEAIFSAFFHQPTILQKSYWKLKTIELLLYLGKTENPAVKNLTEYQSEQVRIVREIHDYMIGHLDQRFTIKNLARQYLMNPTTLKNVFKAIYGTSLAAHIKEHRMEYAARLLLETNDTIAEISKTVGYDTQSKFTAAFKESFQLSPMAYRKHHAKKLAPALR